MESYVRNCILAGRGDGPIFRVLDDKVFAKLDGYVIVPREQIPDLGAFMDSLVRPEKLLGAAVMEFLGIPETANCKRTPHGITWSDPG